MAYRRDIDGLRAVAVLAVVFYHAGFPLFSGGYVGVDVFFVISGFLITSIILEDLRHGRFSIVTFYERRVRRIFPALFAMLAATGIAASWLLLPGELSDLGRSAVAATLFVSNIFFQQTSDYFAGAAHLKPLLHTWSLSVEEQFYVVFPIAMWAIARWGGGRWLHVIVPALVASLAMAVWGAYARPQATFYLAPTRAWELLIGSVLATGAIHLSSRRAANEILGLAGLGMIAAAIVLYSEATVFPGATAILPCIGAALVIHAGKDERTLASRLLSQGPLVRVGLASYSLYLWHWPVMVLARIATGGVLDTGATALELLVSAVLAYLSWRFIERPFRGGGLPIARTSLFASAAAVMMLAIGLGAAATLSDGWRSRFPGYQPPAIAGREDLDEGRCFLRPEQPASAYPGVERCRSGTLDGRKIIVWGDSFAAHLLPGLRSAAPDTLSVLQLNASGCAPIAGLSMARRPHCETFNATALAIIERERPAVVVLSARWEAYMGRWIDHRHVQTTVDRLRRSGADVVLVGQSPSFDFDSPYDRSFRSRGAMAPVNVDPTLNTELATIVSAHYLDPMPILGCQANSCPLQRSGDWLYFDGGHLARAGSAVLGTALAEVLAGLPQKPPALSSVGAATTTPR
jgi:peptidoglycan/LPS O-acetylase OafA/YrhL